MYTWIASMHELGGVAPSRHVVRCHSLRHRRRHRQSRFHLHPPRRTSSIIGRGGAGDPDHRLRRTKGHTHRPLLHHFRHQRRSGKILLQRLRAPRASGLMQARWTSVRVAACLPGLTPICGLPDRRGCLTPAAASPFHAELLSFLATEEQEEATATRARRKILLHHRHLTFA